MSEPAGSESTRTAAFHSPEVRDWLNQSFDQRIAGHRSRADTIKLLTTFALAVGATLVATALQVDDTNFGLLLTAVIFLGLATFLTIFIILSDDITSPNGNKLARLLAAPMDIAAVVNLLHDLEDDAIKENTASLAEQQRLTTIQLILVGLAMLCACIALLWVRA